jgi:hypothetical protein
MFLLPCCGKMDEALMIDRYYSLARQFQSIQRCQYDEVPKSKSLKVDSALLREAFDTGSLSVVVWAETNAQVADTMTKADQKADERLLATLSDGFCAIHTMFARSIYLLSSLP